MKLSPITIAIPLFFVLIGIELFFRRRAYRINDSVTSIGCGTVDQVLGCYAKALTALCYYTVYTNWAIFDIPQTWGWYAACFVGGDFAYYWLHRKSHEVNLMWGGHVVHHQSEEYNLSTALRQGSTQFLWSIPFYMPLALFGFDTATFLSSYAFVTLYQFWIHTETIGRMGPLEWVMNTPSHHRVHHGRDPKYLDRNYAGVFIIWDRLFGTFQEEEERPNYGVTTPLHSWNPLWANFNHYVTIAKQLKAPMSWWDRLRTLFGPPGWKPEELGGQEVIKPVSADYKKYDELVTKDRGIYVLCHFVFAMVYTSYFLFRFDDLDPGMKYGLGAICLFTPACFGALMENQRWGVPAEVARLAALVVVFVLL